MALLGTIAVVVAVFAGLVLGCYLPIRICGKLDGFHNGLMLGGIASLLVAMLTGYLFAGWGEELLGMNTGVPLGLFVGCFFGMATSCFIVGFIGVGIGRFFRTWNRNA